MQREKSGHPTPSKLSLPGQQAGIHGQHEHLGWGGGKGVSSPPGTEPVPPEVEALKEVNVLVAQSCQTLCDPLDCSPPGSSVHGVLQARILEWVAMPYSWGIFPPNDRTWISYISCIGRWILYLCPTWEAPVTADRGSIPSSNSQVTSSGTLGWHLAQRSNTSYL